MKKYLSVCIFILVLCAGVRVSEQEAFAEANMAPDYVVTMTSPEENYRQQVLNEIQSRIEQVYRQYNVNLYELLKIGRLNKYQKNAFIHATETYRKSIFYAIQNLEFYKTDLLGLSLDKMEPGEANRRISEIRMKTSNEYYNLDARTNEYLRTCSFIMPSLSFERYAREFKRAYVLENLYLNNYSTILKIDKTDSKYKL